MHRLSLVLLFIVAVAGCETDSVPDPPPQPKSVPLVKSSPSQDSSAVPVPSSPPTFPTRPPPGAKAVERRTQASAKFEDLIVHLRAKGYDGVFNVRPFGMFGAEESVGYNNGEFGFAIWRYPDAKVASGLGLSNATRLRIDAGYVNGAFVLQVTKHPGWEKQNANIVAAFMEYRP